jgi:hypothetical protein
MRFALLSLLLVPMAMSAQTEDMCGRLKTDSECVIETKYLSLDRMDQEAWRELRQDWRGWARLRVEAGCDTTGWVAYYLELTTKKE